MVVIIIHDCKLNIFGIWSDKTSCVCVTVGGEKQKQLLSPFQKLINS